MRAAFVRLLGALTGEGVRFVVIGGVALVARGGARLTENLEMIRALRRSR